MTEEDVGVSQETLILIGTPGFPPLTTCVVMHYVHKYQLSSILMELEIIN